MTRAEEDPAGRLPEAPDAPRAGLRRDEAPALPNGQVQEIIDALRETRLELDHLINFIPGGIASYTIQGGRFIPTYFSDGVTALSGHSREEFTQLVQSDALDIICEADRDRVLSAAMDAVLSGEVLDISYRMRHKNGELIWIHLNGRRMGPVGDCMRFYAVFTGMSAETRLYRSMASESSSGIYVIGRENYELLYVNDAKGPFSKGADSLGQPCYAALHGKCAPCGFCTLGSRADGEVHELEIPEEGKVFAVRSRETDWNGVPAYIEYVRDVTGEVELRREKERLEQYFQTIVKNLPNGISVLRCEKDGALVPEFISQGLAEILQTPVEELYAQYRRDVLGGVHPDEAPRLREELRELLRQGSGRREFTGRLRSGAGGYLWVKAAVSLLPASEGVRRFYASYTDVTRAVEEREQLRRQYDEILLQHYHTPGPDTLVMGHSNVTANQMLRVTDAAGEDLLRHFGTDRERFFKRMSGLIVDEGERRRFLSRFLRAPALEAFARNEPELSLECYIKRAGEERGRHVEFRVRLLEAPDGGGVVGVLTVTDVTERMISQQILHQLSVTGYDMVVDLDLFGDAYRVLTWDGRALCVPEREGCHSAWMEYMLRSRIVPRDRERYRESLSPEVMLRRLRREGAYAFAFSILDENGDIRTKNMKVTAIDLRLGRVCLARTDITDSVREQQGLLNVVAYTFELASFIDLTTGRTTLYTRRTVLENLTPDVFEEYGQSLGRFFACADMEGEAGAGEQFSLERMEERLNGRPSGYDLVLPYREEAGLRYKQINVMWGGPDHRTVCMVRADVTDMLAAERASQRALEKALALAEEASRAKSDFLSSMSHDIRTPMNAIMGMTALAGEHLDEPERVADCLKKISISSKHLLSLVNDILDMSKIERAQITLGRMEIFLPTLLEQLRAIMEPQARAAGLSFGVRAQEVAHPRFYGDALRLNQILLNLLSNAVKYTPAGGEVALLAEELSGGGAGRVRYRFTVRDTGMGISGDFLEKLFQPFTRSSRAAYVEGTGLGLSITKGLVDLMDGRIDVESGEDRGSTFRVYLSFDVAEDAGRSGAGEQAGAASRSGECFRGRRFLVAEDNAINAEILCELLALRGAETDVATDGGGAVRMFRAAPPGTYDAVLMDVQMPEMNGYEATRAIRGLDRADAASIPIVAMTANAFAEDIQAALEAGMDAHVAKPLDVGLLEAALEKLFRREGPPRG